MAEVRATGVPTTPGPNGSLPLRREIRDLQANYRDQFNLYLLALVDFARQPVANVLSYYQIAGIHGEPYVPYNNVAGDTNASFGGYCTHSSILFLTWHRPYLALYEQALYAIVQTKASQFPTSLRARYVAAAKDFRLPYWDWARKITANTSAFPTAVSSASVSVVDVDGRTKTISNPLYTFRFDDKQIPANLALDDFWAQFSSTRRAPDRNGNSQNTLVSRVLTNEASSLRTNVSLVLLSYTQFDAFSNNQWYSGTRAGRYGSLEDIHNEIHDKVGQGGHMSALDTSAFDPVFWLHHVNVDRLWSLWQALNPNAFVIDKVATVGETNFTISANDRLTASSPLEPFYDASGTRFWTSTGVKSSTPFGYAYPETQRWLYSSDQAYQTAVRNSIISMYGANTISNFFANVAPQDQATAAALDGQNEKDQLPYHDEEQCHEQHPKGHPARLRHNHGHRHGHRHRHKKDSSHGYGGNSGHEQSCSHEQSCGHEQSCSHDHSPSRDHSPRPHKHAHDRSCGGNSAHEHSCSHDHSLSRDHSPRPNKHGHDCGCGEDGNDNPGTEVFHTTRADGPGHDNHPDNEPKEEDILPSHEPIPTMDVVPPQFAHLVHPDGTYTEWITNIRALKHGLGQTFRVYVFLGDFNHDPTTWPTDYNVVGRFTALGRGHNTPYAPPAQPQDAYNADPSLHSHVPEHPEPSPPSPPPSPSNCQKCKKCVVDVEENLHIAGTVPLTTALLQDIVEGKLGSLDKDDVELYLLKNLHWRVTLIDGTEVPRETVPALKVGVVSTKVKIGSDGVPEHTDEYECHPLITDGRPGGFCGGDDA